MTAVNPIPYSALPLPGERRSVAMRGLFWLIRLMAWSIGGAALMTGVTFAASATFGSIVGAIGAAGFALLLVAGAILARGVRRVRDASVLHYLEQAVRLNAPLAEMIAAAQRSEHGAVKKRLERLRQRLSSGEAIARALTVAAPALPSRVTGLVAAGEDMGRLIPSLARVTALRDSIPALSPADAIYFRWYPLVLWTVTFLVLQCALILILPKYQMISRPLPLPPSILTIIKGDAEFWLVAIVVPVTVLFLPVFFGRMLSQIFTARGVTLGPLRWPAELLLWHVPFAGRAVRGRALADACHTIAESLAADLPPVQAIVGAASTAGNFVMRRRLRHWAREMLSGRSIAVAAKKAHLPRLISALLSTAQTPEDWQAVFRFSCRHYDRQYSRTAALLRGAAIPLITLAFGAVALAMALGLFQPLVAFANQEMHRTLWLR